MHVALSEIEVEPTVFGMGGSCRRAFNLDRTLRGNWNRARGQFTLSDPRETNGRYTAARRTSGSTSALRTPVETDRNASHVGTTKCVGGNECSRYRPRRKPRMCSSIDMRESKDGGRVNKWCHESGHRCTNSERHSAVRWLFGVKVACQGTCVREQLQPCTRRAIHYRSGAASAVRYGLKWMFYVVAPCCSRQALHRT